MTKPRKATVSVKGTAVTVLVHREQDYISLTDIARHKDPERTNYLISNWLRNRNTIEFLGIWEALNNPGFNPIEFDGFRKSAGLNSLEEVLLAGVVERFRPGVQTKHIGTITDITAQDCGTLVAAMTKCSKWLPGHDQAPAARAPVPESGELKADIEALENWVGAIRGRRLGRPVY